MCREEVKHSSQTFLVLGFHENGLFPGSWAQRAPAAIHSACQGLRWRCLLGGLALALPPGCAGSALPCPALPVRVAAARTDCPHRPGSLPSSGTCGTRRARRRAGAVPGHSSQAGPRDCGNLAEGTRRGCPGAAHALGPSLKVHEAVPARQRILIVFCQSSLELPLPRWNTVFGGVACFR